MVGRTPRKITLTTTPQNLRDNIPYRPTRSLYFYNTGGNNVWFGKTVAMVVSTSSFPGVGGLAFAVPDSTGDVWACTDAGTQDIWIWDMEQ